MLATDHAPHAIDEKQLPFDEAPFGFIGLETALPLYIESLVTTGLIKWPKLIELLTINPAKLMHLQGYGIEKGCHADFVLLQARDPVEALRLRATRLKVFKRGKVIAETAPAVSRLSLPERPATTSWQI